MNRSQKQELFKSTVEIIADGSYENQDGDWVEVEDIQGQSRRFNSLPAVLTGETYPMLITVVNKDTFDAAADLLSRGMKPAVLNMASPTSPGGGVITGASAQEECLCRRSNLITGLYTFTSCRNFADEFCNNPNFGGMKYDHPLWDEAGIYTRGVTVFRDSNYKLLKNPFKVDVITVASVKNLGIHEELVLEKAKIRSILRSALLNHNDAVVLGAFGCGAFGCNPYIVAGCFRDVLQETEFYCRFKEVVFAILDDTNANTKTGNFRPFHETFN